MKIVKEAWPGCRAWYEKNCEQGRCEAKVTVSGELRRRRIKQAYGELPDVDIVIYTLGTECGPNCSNGAGRRAAESEALELEAVISEVNDTGNRKERIRL